MVFPNEPAGPELRCAVQRPILVSLKAALLHDRPFDYGGSVNQAIKETFPMHRIARVNFECADIARDAFESSVHRTTNFRIKRREGNALACMTKEYPLGLLPINGGPILSK